MRKGSITIYLSLVFVAVLLLISIITESARMNVVQTESKSFTYLAADSVLAGYARQVYEDYGILLVWEEKTLKEQLTKYIQANIELADLNTNGMNIMATRIKDIKVSQVEYVVNNGGGVFIEQVLSYMKYAVATESVSKFIDLYSSNKDNQERYDTTEDMINVKENSEISKSVEDINDEVSNLKESDIKNKLKTEKKRARFLKKVSKIIEKIKSYQEERKEFLKENKRGHGNDYMDSNLEILEQIKDKIEKEELIDSGVSKEKWERIGEEIKNQIKKLTVNIPTEEDEKNKSIYESAKELLEKGILSMVIDDTSNISSTSILNSNLPSKKQSDKKIQKYSVIDKTKVLLYGGMKFGNYCNLKSKSDLKYEMEYIIAGKDNDRSNLTETVEQMVGVRNIATLAYIVTDKNKMTELSAIATSATTAIGLPFLEPVIKAVLTEAWALAEAIHDVKILMEGKRIDFVKNSKTWETDLKSLIGGKTKGSDKKSAIDYKQFCYLLMMKESISKVVLRMMDVIQINIKKNYNQSFDMNRCFTGFRIEAQYETAPLFVTMPWTINKLGESIGAYTFSIKCNEKY